MSDWLEMIQASNAIALLANRSSYVRAQGMRAETMGDTAAAEAALDELDRIDSAIDCLAPGRVSPCLDVDTFDPSAIDEAIEALATHSDNSDQN